MRSDPEICDHKALNKALISGKTYSHDQIKDLLGKAKAVYCELGSSATDYYLRQCIQKFQRGAIEDSPIAEMFEDDEKAYLQQKLTRVHFPDAEASLMNSCPCVSPKVEILIDFLRQEDSQDFSGLIFVQTRAEVAVLSHLLSEHIPSFDISTFIGASSFAGRKSALSELADVKNQKTTLDDLRHGRKNLIVTTNALEEGIDVSRCKLVICFDRPPNLKSFIQRRGRARKSDSKYIIMFGEEDESDLVATWTALEAQMKEMYMDEMRQLEEIEKEEDTLEEAAPGSKPILNQSTGARVTIDDAVQHLYHFCATLPAAAYVDRSPIFSFQDHSLDPKERAISATVILPNSVDTSVRQACGISWWRTEKMAKRDAALECYRALNHAGLIDEHLLPLGHVDEAVDEACRAVEKRPNLVEVSSQINPWRRVAEHWAAPTKIPTYTVQVMDLDCVCSEMLLLLPSKLPKIPSFDLHWDATTIFRGSVTNRYHDFSSLAMTTAARANAHLLSSVFPGRLNSCEDCTALFVPCGATDLEHWMERSQGTVGVAELGDKIVADSIGLVRDLSRSGVPHAFRDIIHVSTEEVQDILYNGDRDKAMAYNNATEMNPEEAGGVNKNRKITPPYNDLDVKMLDHVTKEEGANDVYNKSNKRLKFNDKFHDVGDDNGTGMITLLNVTRLPKKIDFLHRSTGQDTCTVSVPKPRTLLAKDCAIDRLPYRSSQFAMFIPSILHKIEVAMVVDRLCEEVLWPLQTQNHGLFTTAISASSAREDTDYQRLEFFGDSMLKYMTSLTLIAGHLNWHEGILSHKKDHIVSNTSLASAARKTGLDKFILTKPFTGRKWRPLYNSVLLQTQQEEKREMSSKTLADVVEALLGAAYLDGGSQQAIACLKIFLPDTQWLSPSEACIILSSVYSNPTSNPNPSPPHLTTISHLISHPFTSPSLLTEALTHPSHQGPHTSSSYQRLEYLGDALLDSIITRTAYTHSPPLPTPKLHLIRTALANGHFLGYLCLHHSIALPRTEPLTSDPKNIATTTTSRPFHLWQAMRHASPTVARAQRDCVARYEILHPSIAAQLDHGSTYPWSLLARLEPPKAMSDIVESLLGAIYIDTSGSLDACTGFLEKVGLMAYLRRVMAEEEGEGVALLHPKEEVGQLADRERVRYEVGREGEGGDGVDGEEGRRGGDGEGVDAGRERGKGKRLTCRVFVGEREVAYVGDGMSVAEVKVRAAEVACGVLRREGKGKGRGGVEGKERGGGKEEEEGEEDEDDEVQTEMLVDEEGEKSDSDSYVTADE
ncbi:Dicer-like protein 2 [Lecanora helva]